MGKIVAAVTCDIVRSQRYSTQLRRRIDTVLKKEFAKVYKAFPNAIHTPTSFTHKASEGYPLRIHPRP
jgi:hypothetical protein